MPAISLLLTFSSSVDITSDVKNLVKICTVQMRESRMVESGIYFQL